MILFWSMLLVFVAFFFHLVFWKIHLPKRQTKALLQIFFGTLHTGFIIFFKFPSIANLKTPDNFLEYFQIALFFTACTLAYMITYSALEADSPSLVMVRKIAGAGPKGLSEAEFEESMNDDILIKPRIKDLLVDNMAYTDGDKYKLTPKGLLFARIFVFYRKLLNAQKGG